MRDEEIHQMIHSSRRDSGVAMADPMAWVWLLGLIGERTIERVGVLVMHHLVHWFAVNASLTAILVTVAVAVLLVCCLGCSNCPSREKDDLFRRHGM